MLWTHETLRLARSIAWGVLALIACGQLTAARGEPTQDAQPGLPLGRDLLVGVDYYPEHWPESRWDQDLQMMQDADFNVVRLAEFSWAKLEPREDQFDFAWLDRVLDLCQKHNIRVILGTPTAVMPAWLAQRYPEALAMKSNGTRTVWGGRRHNCFSDEDYLRRAQRIVDKLAEHYAEHPAVIGWQIDNELGAHDCACPKCRASFQDWLKRKYGTLDEFNRAWGADFWGLTITDWRQVARPDARSGDWAISNPSASLDWQRFCSDQNVDFLAEQLAILRRRASAKHFITHNFMGLHASTDYYRLARKLDFVSWDNYPPLAPAIPYNSSLAADVMRGLKKRNFLIMEQTAGPLGWGTYSRNPHPGELRKICYQQLAHGADGQIWFRWRSCTKGREQYWHGLLGHDGQANRRYREAAQVAREYRRLGPALAGTTVASDVALVYDYDSLWALEIQPGYPGASYAQAVMRYYRALLAAGVNVDVVHPQDDVAKYKLVVAPHLHVLPDDVATRYVDFVQRGGVLLTDVRTGVKDANNLAHERRLPGLLAPALGIAIDEYESLGLGIDDLQAETTYRLHAPKLGGDFTAIKQADWIVPEATAEAWARYDVPALKDFAAVTRCRAGEGVGWYVGAIVREESFYDALIRQVLADSQIQAAVDPPPSVEASWRTGPNHKLLFLINHSESPQMAPAPAGGRHLLTDQPAESQVALEPFGVAVVDYPGEKPEDNSPKR